MEPRSRKSRTPVQSRGLETRGRIVHAASKVFARQGYHGTNSKDIAREAGVAIGSFYSYFDDKYPLFLMVIDLHFQSIFTRVQNAAKQLQENRALLVQEPRGAVASLLGAVLAAHDLEPDLHREIMAMSYSDAGVRQAIDGYDAAVITWVRSLLETLRPCLRPLDLDAAAHVVWRSVEELVHRLRMFPASLPEESRVISELESMVAVYLFGPEEK